MPTTSPQPITPQPDPTSADTGTLVDLGQLPEPPTPEAQLPDDSGPAAGEGEQP